MAYTATGEPVFRYSDTLALPGMTGDLEALPFYAGQSVGAIDKIESSSYIIATLVTEIADTYKRLKQLFEG